MQTLRRGSRGIHVEFMQRLLVRADTREHADYPYFGSDGRFDGETDRAVRAFQRRHPGLVVDGIVGPQTWTALGLRNQREHPIQRHGQPTGMSCWATAAGMIDASNYATPDGVALGTTGGLAPEFENIEAFARHLGWRMPDHTPDVGELVALLMRTPLWIGVQHATGRHAVVLSGVYSDGDASGQGTMVRIHDPWPVGHGAVYGSFVSPIILRDGSYRAPASLEYLLIPP
ncbi:peptidoglycan-binding protein [Thermomonas aquatica]|jgi:hypothetical protein|uniref:Peptidoglycan binding-like domain-containing protein n=1 Tax=Thermomonas aquatica TaxID=2202149 RepID=A0A5B7ZSU9_9GAMM|nr:peptidoglycan-binding protein [Thermomonas aquatica]QDA58264.1 hypothetical protein FHQ07_13580 [Thermomonas aquatica]